MTHLPPEDQPPVEWRRFASDEEARENAPEQSLTTPEGVGVMFLEALEDPQHYANALQNLTTPESWDSWGDFMDLSKALYALDSFGYSNKVRFAPDAEDVAYFLVIKDVPQSFEVDGPALVDLFGVLSLVWRPELGSWRVHALGDYYAPEDLPRTAVN